MDHRTSNRCDSRRKLDDGKAHHDRWFVAQYHGLVIRHIVFMDRATIRNSVFAREEVKRAILRTFAQADTTLLSATPDRGLDGACDE